MQPPDSRQGRWVPFDEARMILRMSEGTLRRAIKAGKIRAEKRRRAPESETDFREVYEVLVTDPPASAADSESDHPPPDVAAAITAATDPLVERLQVADERIAALDERNERQAAIVVEQAQRIGRLEAERNAAEARATQLAEDLAAEREKRRWRWKWPW
jgi:hypothetical protein